MDKAIVDSIKEFEIKKEFREVKLKTRQSFREDQAALERRLSRRGGKMSNGGINGYTENGHIEKCGRDDSNNSVLSKLEDIVLDIRGEKDKEKKDTVDEVILLDTEDSRSRINSLDNNTVLNGGNGTNENKHISASLKSETVSVSHQNGHSTYQYKMNGALQANAAKANGHTYLHNGQTFAPSKFHVQTNGNRQTGVAVTPDPRIKSFKGIYQKNPKLTAASTEHLDNISLKGFKPSGLSSFQGQRTEYQNTGVPKVPGAEVTSIPADGNLSGFSVDQMVTVFRLLRIPEEIVYRFSKCNVDGKRFAVFTDSEMKDLGINNPVIRYFRDRTAKTHKRKTAKFML